MHGVDPVGDERKRVGHDIGAAVVVQHHFFAVRFRRPAPTAVPLIPLARNEKEKPATDMVAGSHRGFFVQFTGPAAQAELQEPCAEDAWMRRLASRTD